MWTGDNAPGDIDCSLSKRHLIDLQELLKQLRNWSKISSRFHVHAGTAR
jgi:hypothetical protein